MTTSNIPMFPELWPSRFTSDFTTQRDMWKYITDQQDVLSARTKEREMSPMDPMYQILVRLGLSFREGDTLPVIPGMDWSMAVRISDESYVLFVVVKGEPLILREEEPSLFPSDGFITQIRLLQESAK